MLVGSGCAALSTEVRVAAAVAVLICVLVALRAALWWLVGTGLGRWLLARQPPAWLLSAPVWRGFRAGYPGPYAFLRARFATGAFTGLTLTVTGLAALSAGAVLGGLVDGVRETEGLVWLDQGVNAFFVPYRVPWLVEVFVWITAFGSGPVVTGMVVVASALVWSQGRGKLLGPLWLTFLGAQATTWAAKYLIGRTRPAFIDAVTAASPSFPSGHATAATAVFGFLAYIVARDLPKSRARFEVVFWSATAISLICFSRIFLSLHYLSDVVAGLMVGGIWLLAGVAVAELRRRPAS